jgi:glycosyltransferase involved in cell wall biosynthesis
MISIIVPVYNVEKYLRTCIESIINQTYTDWELILVDDGSPDNCPQICDEYAARDARIRTVHRENGGQSAARNSGLSVQKGDFIAFLDSDDFWHERYLEIMMATLIKDDADIVQCSYLRGCDSKFPKVDVMNTASRVYDNHSVFRQFAANIIMWDKIYKSYILDGIKMPEGRIHEDDATTWKLYHRAKRISVISTQLYYYTVNPNSTMGLVAKSPHLDYIYAAYDERIAFFVNNGERDLEDLSRLQLCKSLILDTNNPALTDEQRSELIKRCKENVQRISNSAYVPSVLRLMLKLYMISPRLTCYISRKLR